MGGLLISEQKQRREEWVGEGLRGNGGEVVRGEERGETVVQM